MINIKNNWVYIEGRLDPIGRIENEYYISVRIPKRHYFVKAGGYPISLEVLEWLKGHEISQVMIIEKGMRQISRYTCSVEDYLNGTDVDEGYEKQKCVPLTKMFLIESKDYDID